MVGDLELDRVVCELTDFESTHLKAAEWEEPVLSPRDEGWTGREEDGWRLNIKMEADRCSSLLSVKLPEEAVNTNPVG